MDNYRNFIDDLALGVRVVSLNGETVYANQAFLEIFGYDSMDELKATPIDQRYAPKSLVERRLRKEKRKRGEDVPSEYEISIVDKQGEIRYLQVFCKSIIWDGERHRQVIYRDITARKKTEQTLRESEARLNEAQRMAKIGSWNLDHLTGRLNWSDEMFNIFEIDRARFGASHNAFIASLHPEIGDAIDTAFSQSLTDHKPFSMTHRLPMPDGSIKYVIGQCETFFSPEGKPIRSIGTAQDITELKQAELAMREAEARYHMLFENSPDGVMIIDPETSNIIEFNETMCRQLGYSREEFSKLTLSDYDINLSPDEISSTLAKAIVKGHLDFETHHRTRQGEIKTIHVSAILTKISEWPVLYCVVRDITERRKLQNQLRHAQKIESLGQLAGGIAHDFNNVLNAMIGFTELIKMKMAKDDPAMNYAEEVIKAGMRGAALTRQILAFSRNQPLEMKPVDINDNIANLQKMLRRLVREDISINLKLSDKDLIVMADADQLAQAIINLTTNARDAMPGGGTIVISTERFIMDKKFIRSHGFGHPREYALITFADTGCGMDYETQMCIFDPFFTTKEKGKGTGLGLAAVYGILDQHGGYITVESEPGKGTVFYLYIPLISVAAENTDLIVPEEIRGGTETILIAEDEDTLRALTRTVLAHYGYKIIEAVDGEDAIQKFTKNSDVVEMVILDGIMPKKNGLEALEAMRTLRPEIKAIFVSGYVDGSFNLNDISKTGAAFLQKPVKPADLLRTMRESLDAM